MCDDPPECDRPDCGCEAMRAVDYADARYDTDTVNRCTDSLRRCPDTEEDAMTDTAPMSAVHTAEKARDALRLMELYAAVHMHTYNRENYATVYDALGTLESTIVAQGATIARLTAPIADDAVRAALHDTHPSRWLHGSPDAAVAGHALLTTALKQAESETHRADMAEFRLNAAQNVLRAFIKDNPDAKMLAEVLLEVQTKEATS